MPNLVPFQRGDIVQRNSGGPRMLVEEVEDAEGMMVRCRWYEDRKRREGSFFVDGIHHYQMVVPSNLES